MNEPARSTDVNRPLVHIGYHKSATTWFQRVYYPAVANVAYLDRKRVIRAFLEVNALHWSPDHAREALDAAEGGRIVVCEEGLSGYLHNGGLMGCLSKEVAHRLHSTLPGADLVVFIRRQPDVIGSGYAQYIRGGGTRSPGRYLHPKRYLHGAERLDYKIPRFSFEHFEYLPLLRHYADLFGRDRVHVFLFEAFREDPLVFLEEYERRFDLRPEPRPDPTRGNNASYRPWLVPIGRLVNLFTRRTVQDKYYLVHLPYWYSGRRAVLETLNRLPIGGAGSPACLLGAENVAFIQERYRATNRRLMEEFDLPLDRYGYPL